MTNDYIVEVTITAPNSDWLTDLCQQLVEARATPFARSPSGCSPSRSR